MSLRRREETGVPRTRDTERTQIHVKNGKKNDLILSSLSKIEGTLGIYDPRVISKQLTYLRTHLLT